MNHAEIRGLVLGGALLAVTVLGEIAYPTPWILMSACIFLMLLSLMWERPDLATDEIFGLIILAWAVLSAIITSPDRDQSREFLLAWFGVWIVFVVIRRFTAQARKIIQTFLEAGAFLLALGILFEFAGLQTPRAAGLISNSNLSAALILPVIPLCLARRGRVITPALLCPTAGVAVILSGSRAGLLALILLLLTLIPRGRSSRFLFIALFPAAAAGLIWRLSVNPESLAWFRFKIWGAVLRFLVEHPLFGSGAAQLSTVMGPYRLPHPTEPAIWGHIVGSAENSFLGMAAHIGLPGLLLFFCLLGVWLSGLQPLSAWKQGILLVFAAFLLFHDFLEEPAVLWWWAAIAALLSSPPLRLKKKQERSWFPVLGVLALGSCIILGPAWSLGLWWSQQPSEENVARCLKADPWSSRALEWSVTNSLQHPPSTWDEALAALDRSGQECRLRPGVAAAWDRQALLRSDMFLRFGAFPELVDGARTCIARARMLEPHLPWYPYHLAHIERSMGKLETANAALLDALHEEPHFTRAWLLLSRNDIDLGNPTAARKALIQAIESRKLLDSGQATISYHFKILKAPEWQFRQLEELLQ